MRSASPDHSWARHAGPAGAGPAARHVEDEMTVEIGAPAVDFALEDTRGVIHRLDQYRGRWLLMVFHRHLG